MFYDYHGTILIFSLLFTSTYSCWNTSLHNVTFGHIENLNFYFGESQSKNLSCSWTINNEKQSIQSYYIVSFRIVELEKDQKLESNELIIETDQKQLILDNINQRIFYMPSSSSALQIYFRPKSLWNSLNIHRFLLEFIHVNNYISNHDDDYFRCLKSDLIIPKQWKCNCLNECLYDDYSDEEDCPVCSIIKSYNSLLCHTNETWCLPITNQIDPKGVCIPPGQKSRCSYSSNCETIISYYQDYGEISLDNSILSNRESLCLIIIANEKHKIKLILNQHNFLNQHPDLELLVYDGSEQQNRLMISSNRLLMRQTVQTSQNHITTIIIRKRSIGNQSSIPPIEESDMKTILLNITWLTSLCPDDQMVCGGHFEKKCYTNKQRCDGIWDCISGDDELGCFRASCPTTFACNDPLRLPSDQPRCYTWYERCNGNSFCANRTDERNCTNWWCNSNNGTFLCKNLNCIYETWVCDGTDDCGDNSDEINCPSRIPRRIMTAAVIGATICCTLFIIALGCTCKLFHLRSAERQVSFRLLNPQRYIEQRREELHQSSNSHSTSNDNSSIISNDARRIAPPSYNQTMGFSDDNEERQAFITENLRHAGLANFIPLPSINSNSRHRNRRHRRHHRHHQRRTESENSHVALLEPSVPQSNPIIPTPFTNRFDRFRSQFRSLFTTNLSVNNNSISSNEFDIHERRSSIQPVILSTQSYIEPRELPPPYAEEHLSSTRDENEIQSLTSAPTTTSLRLIRIHKHQIPLNIIRDHLEQQQQQQQSSSSLSPHVTTIDDDEQASSDDDDKMLMP